MDFLRNERRRQAAVSFLSSISLGGSQSVKVVKGKEPGAAEAEIEVGTHEQTSESGATQDSTIHNQPCGAESGWSQNTNEDKPVQTIEPCPPHTGGIGKVEVINLKDATPDNISLTDKRLYVVPAGGGGPCLTFSVIPYQSQKDSKANKAAVVKGTAVATVAAADIFQPNGNQQHHDSLTPDPLAPFLRLLLTNEEKSYGHLFRSESSPKYSADTLESPDFISGARNVTLSLPSYISTTIPYRKQDDLTRERNKQFRTRFPLIEITLCEIKSLKREIKKIILECRLDISIVAHAYVYLEKLILALYVTKSNRRFCAGATLILAAKLCDIQYETLHHLVDMIEHSLHITRKEIYKYEFSILLALKFGLNSDPAEVLPHYQKLLYET